MSQRCATCLPSLPVPGGDISCVLKCSVNLNSHFTWIILLRCASLPFTTCYLLPHYLFLFRLIAICKSIMIKNKRRWLVLKIIAVFSRVMSTNFLLLPLLRVPFLSTLPVSLSSLLSTPLPSLTAAPHLQPVIHVLSSPLPHISAFLFSAHVQPSTLSSPALYQKATDTSYCRGRKKYWIQFFTSPLMSFPFLYFKLGIGRQQTDD